MKFKVLFVVIACSCSLFAEKTPATPQGCPFTTKEMSGEQKKATGIDKLTDDEKEALDAWLCENWNASQKKISMDQQETSPNQQMGQEDQTVTVSISEISSDGRAITLSDGKKYMITKTLAKKTTQWQPGDRVKVSQTKKASVVKIKNLTQDQEIKARVNTV